MAVPNLLVLIKIVFIESILSASDVLEVIQNLLHQKNILNLATCFLREKGADENFFNFPDKKPLFFIKLNASLSFINN